MSHVYSKLFTLRVITCNSVITCNNAMRHKIMTHCVIFVCVCHQIVQERTYTKHGQKSCAKWPNLHPASVWESGIQAAVRIGNNISLSQNKSAFPRLKSGTLQPRYSKTSILMHVCIFRCSEWRF